MRFPIRITYPDFQKVMFSRYLGFRGLAGEIKRVQTDVKCDIFVNYFMFPTHKIKVLSL